MRYFVTGGAGFIGSNYVDLILREDLNLEVQVTVFDKLTYAGNLRNLSAWEKDPRLTIVIGDICDKSALATAMTNHDYVVHFAAESHVDRSINSAEPFIQTNVLGTLNVLEVARANNVKTFIHVSTDEVYGSLEDGSATEESPLLPNSPYAASKAASDLLVRSFHRTHGLDVRITRCSNNYGRYQYPEKFIPVILKNLFSNNDIPIYGSGKNIREWIYVEDHCARINDVLNHGKAGEIYNIGTGNELSNLELTNTLISLVPGTTSKVMHVVDRLGHDFRYSVSLNKIEAIQTSPNSDFLESLKLTVTWYKNNAEYFQVY